MDLLTTEPNDSRDSSVGVTRLNSMRVNVRTTPPEEVHAVEAEYAGVTIPLTRNEYNGTYYGTFDLTEIPYGRYTLKVTAYDRYGEASTIERLVYRYAPPTMRVVSPRPYTPITRDTPIVARCVATLPFSCINFRAIVSSQFRKAETLYAGPSTVPGVTELILPPLSPPLQPGEVLRIGLQSENPGGGVLSSPASYGTYAPVYYVEESPKLSVVQRAPGAIIDFDATRILFLDHNYLLGVVDRATELVTYIGELQPPTPHTTTEDYGALTPSGVVMQSWNGYLFAWANGLFSRTERRGWIDAVNGDSLLWMTPDEDRINLLTLTTDVDTTFHLRPGTTTPFQADIADSGDIYYSTYEEPSIRGPGELRLGDHPGYLQRPITDGTNVAGRWWNGAVCSSYLYTADGQEVFLGDSRQGNAAGLLLHGGYTAFLKSDGAVNQVWVRTPAGDLHQLSDFPTSSRFDQQRLRIGHDGISDTGDVVFLNDGKRYIGRPGEEPEEIGSDLGHARWFDGGWYVTLGNTLFEVAAGDGTTGDGAVATEGMAGRPVMERPQEGLELMYTAPLASEAAEPPAPDPGDPEAAPDTFDDFEAAPLSGDLASAGALGDPPPAAMGCSAGRSVAGQNAGLQGAAALASALVGLTLARRGRRRCSSTAPRAALATGPARERSS
ncbi:hypothetical protein WMF20_48950 [Sorangium sp. So ce834]|uniref:hypothetical protein n=1 Tax=Sorangium sp. So ce834 TaxID=3133321 RepID=UPI003F5F84CA